MTSNWKTPDLEDSTRPELTQCCACYNIYRYLALIIYLNKCSTKNLYLSIICLLLEEISSDTFIKDSQWPFTFYMKLFPSHILTYCHNPNSTATQLNLTSHKLALAWKCLYTLHPHPPHSIHKVSNPKLNITSKAFPSWTVVVACRVIFVSSTTFYMLGWVELRLSWGFDNRVPQKNSCTK